MKKQVLFGAALCAAVLFTGCKSSESAYKKAYEKAKAQEVVQQAPVVEDTPITAPLQTTPSTDTKVVDNGDNVPVRQESVSVISGSGLKSYSVVVGSFGLISNAEGLQQRLKDNGYDAQIVKNTARNMFRVVAATFDDKAAAVQSRNSLRSQYPDAWLLNGK